MLNFVYQIRNRFTGRDIYSSTFLLSVLLLLYTYMLFMLAHFCILDFYFEQRLSINRYEYLLALVKITISFDVSAEIGEFPSLMSKMFKLFLLLSFFVPWILFSSRLRTRFQLSVLYGLIINICLVYLYFQIYTFVAAAVLQLQLVFLFLHIFISINFFIQGMMIVAPPASAIYKVTLYATIGRGIYVTFLMNALKFITGMVMYA